MPWVNRQPGGENAKQSTLGSRFREIVKRKDSFLEITPDSSCKIIGRPMDYYEIEGAGRGGASPKPLGHSKALPDRDAKPSGSRTLNQWVTDYNYTPMTHHHPSKGNDNK